MATCSCETSRELPRSRTREEDRKSSSSRSTSSRLTSTTHSVTIQKAMIREMGNAELFELCETIPKVQCSQCILYWNQGVIYCTCGHFLVESESRRKFNKLRLDALSIPHCVIKKGRPHGARHGRSARSSKTRGLLQSVLALCMTEEQLARLALHAPPDEILACVIVVAMQSACTWQNACSKRSTISQTRRWPSWP